MAYRWLGSLLVLLWSAPVHAQVTPKVALVVDGGGEHRDELKSALAKALGAEPATTAQRPSDTAGLQGLRATLDVARVVVVLIEQQGHDRYPVAIHSADEAGVAHRFGDASGDGLVKKALELATALPPLPPPRPIANANVNANANESANDNEKPPITGAVETPKQTSHPTETIYKRRHPWAMLVGGVVSFFVPYFVTVGFAASYASYNANAARVGYIPVAGPFLARQRINDTALKDGSDPGLLVDGIVQTLTFNLLIAGIIYCAVGEKRAETRYGRIQPMFSLSAQEARMGALVTW